MRNGALTLHPTARRWLYAVLLLPLAVVGVAKATGMLGQLRMVGLAAVVGLAGCVVFLRPRWGVYFLALYTYGGLKALSPDSAAAAVMVVVAAATLLGFLRGENLGLRDGAFWWSLGFFILLSLHSTLYAHHVGLAFVRLLAYAKALILVVLIVQHVRTPGHLRLLSLVVFWGSVGSILLGIGAVSVGTQLTTGSEKSFFIRLSGLHADANFGAAYMCAALPLGVFAVKHATRAWERTIHALGVAILTTGVFLTFSRGGFFALAVVIVGVVTRELRSRQSVPALVALVGAVIVLAPREYWERILFLSHIAENVTQDWSVLMRWRALDTAWQIFQDHPLVGIGPGNFVERGAVGVWMRVPVHNAYVEVLVSTGVLGLAAFLAVLGSALRLAVSGARREWRRSPEWMRSMAFYWGLSLVAGLFAALFLSISYRYLLWIPVAGILVVGNLIRREEPSGAGTRP